MAGVLKAQAAGSEGSDARMLSPAAPSAGLRGGRWATR